MKDEDLPELGDDTLQDLIDEFQSLNCKGDYAKEHQAKNYVNKKKQFEKPVYCSAKLKDEIFNKVPALGYSPINFNSWILQ